jgi:hypothetical protein
MTDAQTQKQPCSIGARAGRMKGTMTRIARSLIQRLKEAISEQQRDTGFSVKFSQPWPRIRANASSQRSQTLGYSPCRISQFEVYTLSD